MRNYFLLCGAATAGLFLLNTTGATAQTAAVSVPRGVPGATGTTSLNVVVLPAQESDLGLELLGPNIWRFVITAPKSARTIDLILEVQEKGKPVQFLVTTSLKRREDWPIDGRLTVLVAQAASGEDLKTAARAKYLVQVNGFSSASTDRNGFVTKFIKMPGFGLAATNNVFHGTAKTEKLFQPKQCPDGSFLLISGSNSAKEAPDAVPDTALVFRVQENVNSGLQAKNH